MVYRGRKNDIITAYEEAGKPLDAETRRDFDEAEDQLRELKLGLDFVVLAGKCRICNYEETVIVPAVVDLDNLECLNCENRTMQEKEEPGMAKDAELKSSYKIEGNWLRCSCGTQTYLPNKDNYIATCAKCGHTYNWKHTCYARKLT